MRGPWHIVSAGLLASAAAGASERFPGAIATHLSLSYVPACSLCHVAAKTGVGTAEMPFAQSARARGLQSGGKTDLLVSALDAMARDGVDSDGDGVADIAELVAGTDPNVAGGSSLELRPDPGYGCGSAGGAGLGALIVALALAKRRSATRRRLGEVKRFG